MTWHWLKRARGINISDVSEEARRGSGKAKAHGGLYARWQIAAANKRHAAAATAAARGAALNALGENA